MDTEVKPVSTGVWAQIGLYAASIFLPPLNLIWTIKYLKSTDEKAKKIGVISLVIMVVALVGGVLIMSALAQSVGKQIQQELEM